MFGDALGRQPVEVASEERGAGLAALLLHDDGGAAHAAREVGDGVGEEEAVLVAVGGLRRRLDLGEVARREARLQGL